MIKEKVEQNKFYKHMTAKGAMIFKTHGDELSSGQPDHIGAYKGVPFVIEWKREGEDPTPLQMSILTLWAANGVDASVQVYAKEAVDWVMDLVEQKKTHDLYATCDCGRNS